MIFRVPSAVAILCLVLTCRPCAAAWAQALASASAPANASVTQQPASPDQAFLSNYRYANAYFGFSLDFPNDAGLRAVPASTPSDGSIPLLEALGPAPQRAVLEILAYPPAANRPSDARALLRQALDHELTIGVEELHGLSKTNIAGHLFYLFETRRGIDQHMVFATDVDGYLVQIVAAARDPKLIQQLQAAVAHMHFFPPTSIADYAGVGAAPYNGPAIPYRVLQKMKSDPPVAKLDSGNVHDNVYDNHQLGFAYLLPKGWNIRPQGAVLPAIERSQARHSTQGAASSSEQALMKACERTLVSSWRQLPQQSGDISYDDFGEVTLSAMSMSCYPNLKFPNALDDKNPVRDFILGYGLTHPILREMKGAHAFETGGRTFIVMEGVVAYQEEGDALSRRVSVALALTEQRGYLLSFFFAAPHDAELRELMNAKASFDAEPVSRQSAGVGSGEKEVHPGGSVAPVSAPESAAERSPKAATSAADAQTPGTNAAAGGQPAAQAGPSTDPAPDSIAARPSLLKPGETMQDQQLQGKPLPAKSPH